jgi:hypothetical protein
VAVAAAAGADELPYHAENTNRTERRASLMNSFKFSFGSAALQGLSWIAVAGVLWLAPALCVNGAAMGKSFPSPDDAIRALSTAVNNRDSNALAAIFGPAVIDLKSPDPVEAQNELATFAKRLNVSHHVERAADGRYILEVGEDGWPFAIPIVKTNNGWFFDTQAGKEELLNRRIGENELQALDSLRAGAQAQREYASKDRDGDQVLEYAQKIISTAGQKDGLYWSQDLGEMSPLGPAFAEARREGYLKEGKKDDRPQPFHGYFFKILTRQGSHAPAGAYDYIINGHMIGGYAFVAWPAKYGVSGIMTFIINQQGKVYQKDLGPDTESTVQKMNAYDPDKGWSLSRD